jgi:hypothetical protein
VSPDEVKPLLAGVVIARVVVTRVVVVIALLGSAATANPPSRPAQPAKIDFAADDPDGALGEQITAPPPDIRHPSLLSDKYRGVAHASADAGLDDPLALRAAARSERRLWLGARLGAGMFDDAATSARAGFALAASSRYRIADAVFLAARADWTRRGGSSMTGTADTSLTADTVDALGASMGAGITVLGRSPSARNPHSVSPAARPPPRPALALIAQLRADLRLTDRRDAAPVRRAGLGIATGAELALPSTPFSVGARFEQALTELTPGARDRAILVEVGIDLR